MWRDINVLRHAGPPNCFKRFLWKFPRICWLKTGTTKNHMQAWRIAQNYGPRAWSQKMPADNQAGRHTEGHIKLYTWFESIHIYLFDSKKARGRPDRETDGRTYKLDWNPLGDKDYTPDLNPFIYPYSNPKIPADNQTYRQDEGHISSTGPHWGPTYLSLGEKVICRLGVARTITGRVHGHQKLARTTIQTERHIRLTGSHWGIH